MCLNSYYIQFSIYNTFVYAGYFKGFEIAVVKVSGLKNNYKTKLFMLKILNVLQNLVCYSVVKVKSCIFKHLFIFIILNIKITIVVIDFMSP